MGDLDINGETFIDYKLSLCVINRFESKEKRQKKKRGLYAAKVYQLHTGDWSNLSYLTVLTLEGCLRFRTLLIKELLLKTTC